MSRVTLRTSTILIATKEKTDVYRNLKDVPPKLRKKLVQTTSGANSATILIADRKGRQELARAVRGLPGDSVAKPTSPVKGVNRGKRQKSVLLPLGVIWAELLIAGGLGLLIWLLITSH
jgi:hypothetical protein